MELTVFTKLHDAEDNDKNQNAALFEVVKLKTGLVFASWVRSIGTTLETLKFLHYKEKASREVIIANYKVLCCGPGRNSLEEVDNYFKTHHAITHKKNKNKNELIQFVRGENLFKTLKGDLINYSNQICEIIKVKELDPFFDQRALVSISIITDRRTEHFIQNLTDYNVNYCLDGVIFAADDAIIDSKTISFQQRDDWSFYNIPLFQLPDLNSMNYNQLKIIRSEFVEKFTPFYKSFCDMQTDLFEILYNETTFETIQQKIEEVFNPHLAVFKEATENNLYLNMIKNSIPDVPVYQFSAVVTSLNSLIQLFVKDNIITPEEKEIIIEGVSRTKDINSTVAFFYLDKIQR